jgi:ribosomal protein S18
MVVVFAVCTPRGVRKLHYAGGFRYLLYDSSHNASARRAISADFRMRTHLPHRYPHLQSGPIMYSVLTPQVSPPHTYEEASMYPEARRPARLPIMGPPNRVAKLIDPFHIRHSNPLEHAMNPLMCYKFINSMGKIKPRAETGLTWRSQRLVGKMVRRARAMGVIPRWDNRPRPGGLGDSDYASR